MATAIRYGVIAACVIALVVVVVVVVVVVRAVAVTLRDRRRLNRPG